MASLWPARRAAAPEAMRSVQRRATAEQVRSLTTAAGRGDGEAVGGGADLGSEAGIGFQGLCDVGEEAGQGKARIDGTRVCFRPTTAGGTEAPQRVEGWTNSG